MNELEEINRLARLCEAKDAEIVATEEYGISMYNETMRLQNKLMTANATISVKNEQLSDAHAQIAMQADVLSDIIPFIGYQQHVPHLVKRAEDVKSATSETVAAFRAKETEPLREQIKFLSDWKEKAMAHMTTTDALIKPLRREVAMLHKNVTDAYELLSDHTEIPTSTAIAILGNVLHATQATALAYEREVKAKALEDAASQFEEEDEPFRTEENMQHTYATRLRSMAAELRASKGEVK